MANAAGAGARRKAPPPLFRAAPVRASFPGAVAARRLALALRFCAAAALAVPGAALAGDPSPPHSLGACGGTMLGEDGRQYACAPDRRPACNEEGARCVCLEQRDCGGTRDEPY